MDYSGSKDFIRQNEIRMNNLFSKTFAGICFVPLVILLMVKLGLYNFSMAWAIFGTVYSFVLGIIFLTLAKFKIASSGFKYFTAVCIQSIIFIYSTDVNIGITVLFMAVPMLSLFYFNPRLEIVSCSIAIISMLAGVWIQAPGAIVKWGLEDSYDRILYMLTTGSAHFMEMVVASIIFVSVSILTRRLMFSMKENNEKLESIQNDLVYSFADMIESRDGTTGEHVKRTSQVVSLISLYIQKHPEDYSHDVPLEDLKLFPMAAPLHDIGKMKVPDAILSKPGKLDDKEYAIIKTHSMEGALIIDRTMTNIEDPLYVGIARDMALSHHEKWDGTGYPNGIKGEDIPISARIMAVADVFDAL